MGIDHKHDRRMMFSHSFVRHGYAKRKRLWAIVQRSKRSSPAGDYFILRVLRLACIIFICLRITCGRHTTGLATNLEPVKGIHSNPWLRNGHFIVVVTVIVVHPTPTRRTKATERARALLRDVILLRARYELW